MTAQAAPMIDADLDLYQCPGCASALSRDGERLHCADGGHSFGIEDGIPLLFWPNEWNEARRDVTETVRAFYEKRPFPAYDDFEDISSLQRKARDGMFARLLDEQLPPGIRVLEVGCGTGQLSNFLSIANRQVFASDLCLSSLRLGKAFCRQHDLDRVRFVQQNLFRPAFKPQNFDLVACTGVLHHTSDPFLAFETISQMVRPGGYLLVGLYHRYGRLMTDVRRVLFRLSGERFHFLDPNLRRIDSSDAKRKAWLADQYEHPHESRHTIGETIRWIERIGFEFVSSIPSSKPRHLFAPETRIFEVEQPGGVLERLVVELGMMFRGGREGGLFLTIGRRPQR